MTTTSLVFGGVNSVPLLVTLMLAIAAVLLAWGVYQLTCRRWQYAAVCIAASMGPLVGLLWHMGPGAWMVLLGAQVVLAVGVFYAAVYSHLGGRRLAALMALRSAAIIALLAALFKPAICRTFHPAPPRAAKLKLAIVVDRSASMSSRDVGEPAGAGGEKPTRYEHAVAAMRRDVAGLQNDFRLAWYHFARSSQVADSPDSLAKFSPSGDDCLQTEIRKALLAVRQDIPPDEMAGILLVTDGVNNPREADPDAGELLAAAGRVGAPVYAATVGSAAGPIIAGRNVRILSVLVSPPVVMKNNVANVKVSLDVSGFARSSLKIGLYEDDSPNEADSVQTWTHKDQAELEAELKWTPRQRPEAAAAAPDIRRLRVAVSPQPGELDTSDNAARVNVLVTQGRIRLLYIEGSMRPEYKYLKRFFDTDPNIQFMSLVRVSGDKFWAYGSLDGRKLPGLPVSEEHFKLFDVLIIGDLDRTFLGVEQMRRIRRFVSDGGGLLAIGGTNSLGPGGFGGTDIEQALPVFVGGRDQPQETTPFIPKSTPMGLKHPILDGLAGYFIGPDGGGPDGSLPRLGELLGCVTVPRVKPAADTLLVHPSRGNDAGPLVVLAAQPYGVGRSAVLTADTTWKWFMELRARGGDGPYERLWGQLVRWLAGADTKSRDAAGSVVLQLTPSRTVFAAGQAVAIGATVRSARADDQAPEVTCKVSPAAGGDYQLIAMKPGAAGGRHEAFFKPDKPGEFILEAVATDSAKKVLATDRLPLIVSPARDAAIDAETAPAKLKPDRELMERLSVAAGGEHRDISQLHELVELIRARRAATGRQPARQPPPTLLPEYGSATMTVLFLAFVALLTCEWLARRYWQLH
jgi:uncharacterized membrane protein